MGTLERAVGWEGKTVPCSGWGWEQEEWAWHRGADSQKCCCLLTPAGAGLPVGHRQQPCWCTDRAGSLRELRWTLCPGLCGEPCRDPRACPDCVAQRPYRHPGSGVARSTGWVPPTQQGSFELRSPNTRLQERIDTRCLGGRSLVCSWGLTGLVCAQLCALQPGPRDDPWAVSDTWML